MFRGFGFPSRAGGESCFAIEVLPDARNFLLARGVSEEYGARELKRTIHRQLTQPLATMVARGEINPAAIVSVSHAESAEKLSIKEIGRAAPAPPRPAILIVDDNHDLLLFLATELEETGWEMLMAENAEHARFLFREMRPGAVLLDYMLGDDDGLKLGLEFQARAPAIDIIIMTGGGLSDNELKPFLAGDVLNLIRRPYRRPVAAAMGSATTADSQMQRDSA